MKNESIKTLDNKCKKDKETFFFILRRIILALCVILLFFILYKIEEGNKNEVISAFKDGNDVICKSSIVSIKNGYNFEENRKFFVNDGANIFNL